MSPLSHFASSLTPSSFPSPNHHSAARVPPVDPAVLVLVQVRASAPASSSALTSTSASVFWRCIWLIQVISFWISGSSSLGYDTASCSDAGFRFKYLLILDRTNWRTNILTSLLVPYIFFSLPHSIFHFFRGEIGKWIAIVAVVLRLFFSKHFPDWLELSGSMILLLVVAPDFFAIKMRNNWIGLAIDLIIGCYLLQEHIRASGGFRNSFTQKHGLSNTLGILLLLVYPIWSLVIH